MRKQKNNRGFIRRLMIANANNKVHSEMKMNLQGLNNKVMITKIRGFNIFDYYSVKDIKK